MRSTYRNKKWLAAVGQIEQCVLCGAWGVQVAHRCRRNNHHIGCVYCHDQLTNQARYAGLFYAHRTRTSKKVFQL